jgi:hypothetical protein
MGKRTNEGEREREKEKREKEKKKNKKSLIGAIVNFHQPINLIRLMRRTTQIIPGMVTQNVTTCYHSLWVDPWFFFRSCD